MGVGTEEVMVVTDMGGIIGDLEEAMLESHGGCVSRWMYPDLLALSITCQGVL